MLMLTISELLLEQLTPYPRAKDEVARQLSQAFQRIYDQEFGAAKDRVCLFKELMSLLKKKPMKLDKQVCVPILEAVLEGNVDQAKANVKWSNAASGGATLVASRVAARDDLFRRATDAARKVTDSQFLTWLGEDLERFTEYGVKLKPLADKAKERAFVHLEVAILRTVRKLTVAVHSMKEEECIEQIKRESARRGDEELDKLRANLIKHVNDLSAQTLHSCVSSPFLVADCDPRLTLLVGIRWSSTT